VQPGYSVNTYDHRSRGVISIQQATLFSDNTVFSRLTCDVTPQKVYETATKMGLVSLRPEEKDFLALGLGVLIATLRVLPAAALRGFATAYVEMLRNIPLLVQLFFLYFALPRFGITLSALVVGVLALGVHYATYTSEVYRAGIESVVLTISCQAGPTSPAAPLSMSVPLPNVDLTLVG